MFAISLRCPQGVREILLKSAEAGEVCNDMKLQHVGEFSAKKGTTHAQRRVCLTDWGAVRSLRDGETPEQAADALCKKLFD